MRNKLIYTVLLIFCFCCNATAQNTAEEINRRAQDDNFIKAGIIAVSPGGNIYNNFGHTALRLQCPSNRLDFCFSFEMNMDESTWLDFVMRKTKAGFMSVPTSMFLNQYKDSGRGVREYTLNLTPLEKQELWRILDKEVAGGSTWTFDCYSINCSSMVLYAVTEALQNEKITFTKLNKAVEGTYGAAVGAVNENSPWLDLFWQMSIFSIRNEQGDINGKMATPYLEEALPSAIITDSTGKSRPFIKGKGTILIENTFIDKACPFTPVMAMWLAIVLILIITTFCVLRKRHTNKK